ncbi:aldo/keto reductase, partial [Candidatus Obscuribacterales bacterium]|nr:aldo/keto reductase [Candidatus Obscuribacterales bacterium]
KKYLNERGFKIVEALHVVASELSSKPAQVALAWIMARPSITAPIASATNLGQLADLIAASKLELSVNHLRLLNEASAYQSISV